MVFYNIRKTYVCLSKTLRGLLRSGAGIKKVSLLALCLATSLIGCARGNVQTAEAYKCYIPICVEDIYVDGLRDVNCSEDVCFGEELKKYDLNMADALTCIYEVYYATMPCKDVKK